MNQRGEYGPRRGGAGWQARAHVGAEPLDAVRALQQIDAEMEAIVDAMYRAMGVGAWQPRVLARAKAKQSPLWPYWESSVSPKYADWRMTQAGFASRPMSAEEYDRWFGRVAQLRADVRDKGVTLKTPDLVHLTRSQAPGTPGKLLKWGAIGALAIGGVALLASLASATR